MAGEGNSRAPCFVISKTVVPWIHICEPSIHTDTSHKLVLISLHGSTWDTLSKMLQACHSHQTCPRGGLLYPQRLPLCIGQVSGEGGGGEVKGVREEKWRREGKKNRRRWRSKGGGRVEVRGWRWRG